MWHFIRKDNELLNLDKYDFATQNEKKTLVNFVFFFVAESI